MSEAGSGIEGLRQTSRFAAYVADTLGAPFKLVDVGCAGGSAPGWRAFGRQLSAIGFDTNAAEVARLNAAEANPAVRYAAGWVGLPDGHPLKQRIGSKAYWHHWPAGRLAYERTYDLRRARADGREPSSVDGYFKDAVLGQDWLTTPVAGFDLDYQRTFEVFPPPSSPGPEALAEGPETLIHLPAYLKAAEFYDADFLKLDIDGPDYEVLRSITDLLAQPTLLGVSLEVCFYGSHDANDNSFHNMDRLMREKGFDLLGLSVRTYASAALPFPYLDAHPSMNTGGRPIQGDALYVRDLGSRVRSAEAAALSDQSLAKTAALLALFTLPDHAAEILVVHRERLSHIMDVDHGLDLLSEELQQDHLVEPGYRRYLAAFERDDPRFFDRYGARNAWMTEVLEAAAREGETAARLAAAQARLEAYEQATPASAPVAGPSEADVRLAMIEQSTSWRLTAPLRALVTALKRPRA